MISLFSHRRQITDEELSDLFRRAYPRLYRVAFSLLNDKEDSRDLVNDVFMYMIEKQRLTTDVTESYLITMVRNRSIDQLRHRQVMDEARADIINEYRLFMETDNTHDDRIEKIRHFIETELTPQTRKVLQLCYDEKKTYQEVASELGVSVQAVNKHISQALRKLRERFNPASIQPSKSFRQ